MRVGATLLGWGACEAVHNLPRGTAAVTRPSDVAGAQVAQKQAELQVAEIDAAVKASEILPLGSAENYTNGPASQSNLHPFQPTYGGSTIVDAP